MKKKIKGKLTKKQPKSIYFIVTKIDILLQSNAPKTTKKDETDFKNRHIIPAESDKNIKVLIYKKTIESLWQTIFIIDHLYYCSLENYLSK